ncbi:ATP-binding protein [Synechococcus elongatus]|uniref:DUF87 domain-containing protein n=1 Tax=Synechococcus elongatus PCC 11802 TaxID=2283154 RepID=A0AAT9JTX9_SYNEL|nr:DUF87 domain-containing protein [Synechococcus elongatus]QFZ92684.1 DUF87 domain-containing protein [Synechococcus elongatus PCC 11802]
MASSVAAASLPPTASIGTVKGPGEQANQYVFITAENHHVRVGEFVYYQLRSPLDDSLQAILGKISGRRLIEHLPDRIFADVETSPEAIAALIGFTYDHPELYEVTVEVIGYFQPGLGFINPRRAPDPGARVYLAEDQRLQQVLNRRHSDDVGAAHVGSLLLRDRDAVPIILDVKELVSTHMAILAGTGSGKSYTAGVLIEELLRPQNRAAVLIFDPHGEYGTLEGLRGNPIFEADGYRPTVKVLTPEDIRIRISSLNFYDLLTLLPQTTERQQAVLEKAVNSLRKNKSLRDRWDFGHLIEAVKAADTSEDDEGNETMGPSAQSLSWRLERLQSSPYFHSWEHLIPRDLFEPGQATILQMNEIPQEQQQVICTVILNQSYTARINTVRGGSTEGAEDHLPYPIFALVEEAHRFAPAHEPSRCKQILRTVLSEGRKFGFGMGLITQRPGKIDSDILSQCMSQFLMRIVNPVDQESLKHGVEAAGRDLLQELPSLSRGQVIISGACVNTPVLCQVRTRYTQHGGETMNAPEEWQKHFQGTRAKERELTIAPIASRPAAVRRRNVTIE